MKTIYSFFLILLCALAFVSCEWQNNAQYSPQLVLSVPMLSCPHDTVATAQKLNYRYDKDGRAVLDTIHVGDTVQFSVQMNALGNMLTAFHATWDTALLHVEFLAMDSILFALDTAKCDFQGGDLYFLPGYNMGIFPIRYTPRQAATANFEMELQSDSQFSPTQFTIQQTAR